MPCPARHPADPAATLSRILKAAQEEMLVSGLAGATIDRVATRASASKQTIYGLFPAKDDLFRAALRLTISEASETGTPDIAELSVDEAVVEFARWVQRSSRRPANLGLYRANIAGATASPELAADLHRLRTGASPLIGMIEALQRQKLVPAFEPARLANWFGVLSIGGLRDLIGVTPHPDADQARIEALVDLFTRGWRLPAARRTPASSDVEDVLIGPADERGAGRTSPEQWTRVLKIAADNLLLKGSRSSSIDDVATASGVAKMTIYRRYGRKEKLLEAALHQTVSELTASPPQIRSVGLVHEVLTELAFDYDRRFARPRQIRLLRLLVAEAPARPALSRGIWQRLLADDHRRLTSYLASLDAAGELHVTNAAIAAEQFLLLASRGNRRLTDPVEWNVTEARQHAADVVAFCLRL